MVDSSKNSRKSETKKIIDIREIVPEDFVNVALDTIAKNKQALVFVNSKKSAESSAEKIAKKIESGKLKNPILEEISNEIIHLPRPTKQCERLSHLVKKGVAFHHAGLTPHQRDTIEEQFKLGNIKIICSTPTLAAGVDLPAFRAIIKDVKRFNGRWGMDYIAVLEYMQQAGRAGRPGKEDYGEAIIFAENESEKSKLYEKYVLGVPEKIYSKLAVEPVLRTYVLSLVAAGYARSKKELLQFFSETFYAMQFADMPKLDFIITKMIDLLDEIEFIKVGKLSKSGDGTPLRNEKGKNSDSKSANSYFVSADQIDDVILEPTILGKRVAELYIDPLTAHFLIEAMKNAATKKIAESKKNSAFSFLQIISHTMELRPLLRAKTKDFEELEKAIVFYEDDFLEEIPSPYDEEYEDFLASVKTAMFFNDWVNEFDEETLLEKYEIRPGEIKAKLDSADWIIYSAEEIAKILHFQKITPELSKLRIRLKEGAKEELLPLLRLKNVGRIRARKLFQNKICDLGDIKKTDFYSLAKILGKKTAENVLEQVGIKVTDEASKDAIKKAKESKFDLKDPLAKKKEKQGRLDGY